MRWTLILALAPLGTLVGVLSLFGLWRTWMEFVVWLVVGAAWVTVLHVRLDHRYFLHGFLTALIGGVSAVVVQALFATTYVANNPDVRSRFGSASVQHVRLSLMGTGLVVNLLFALVIGAALWLTIPKELRARKSMPRPPPPDST
jgi:hypothetical protein